MLTHTEKSLDFSLDDINILKTLLCRMSTRFYYCEISVKPLTLHATDSLFSCRGCNARRIRFQRRGTTTAGCFKMDPHKMNLSGDVEIYFTGTFKDFWVLWPNFILARPASKICCDRRSARVFSRTRLVLNRWISTEPTLNISAGELPDNFYSRMLSNGPV